jgi:DNA-binding ferritin-like protein
MWSRLFRRRTTLRESIVAEVLSHVAEANAALKTEILARTDAVATLAQIKEAEYKDRLSKEISVLVSVYQDSRAEMLKSIGTLYARVDDFTCEQITKLQKDCMRSAYAGQFIDLEHQVRALRAELTRLRKQVNPKRTQ